MFGGIKIKSNKNLTRYESIENLPVPAEVTLYTSQHIGAPSKPVVKRGDEVKKGQLIAEPSQGCSAALHASINGKVKEISTVDKPGGVLSEAIIIQKDGEQEAVDYMRPLKKITAETIRARVLEAGIVGMGGAGFPAHIKLNPPKKIDTALLNGCECEPFLTADERVMIEEAEKVVDGFKIAIEAVGAQKGVIGIEDDKPQAIDAVKKALAGQDNMEVAVLPKVYPQGYEKKLITAVTGREVPSGGLPHDVGVSVHNVGTCAAIHEAVHEGKPLIERVLTFSGPEAIERANLKAPVGMSISEIFNYYHIEKREEYEIYMGGPMMGFCLDSVDAGIMKTTSGILVSMPVSFREYPCLRCGKCEQVCPVYLVPQQLNNFYDGRDWDRLKENGLFDCMECGCCSYICPSGIPLTYKFKTAKTKVKR